MAFDFSKFKIPGLFSQKADLSIEKKTETEEVEKISFRRFGFVQAGMMKGRTEGLKICLDSVFETHMAEMRRDENKQEELRRPYRAAMQDLLATNDSVKSQIKMFESELIPTKKAKIDELKKEIVDIRKNPEHYTGVHVGKAGFYIGVFILSLLSIYLFIFYSSASYSAFFKEFKADDIVITKAIFDANAIGSALKDGITELIFILTIPFVFIGLGYLIHKFQEAKGFIKYTKIAGLLIITFIFDSIIAYEITEKIYNIKKEADLKGNLPDFSVSLAFSSVSFWLVIFAGFVVYLIWGFVFDFVMEAHAKLDIVKVNIKMKRDQIHSIEQEIIQYENKITELRIAIEKNNVEITKVRHIIEGTIIQPKAVKEALSQFMVGWYNWLAEGREYNRSEHNKIYEEFIENNITVIESVIHPN
jgi:hypothetical protein